VNREQIAFIAAIAVLLVLVGGVGAYALTLRSQVTQLSADLERTQDELEQTRRELADLRDGEAAQPEGGGGLLDGLLEGLGEDGGLGGLEDLLGGLGELGGLGGGNLAALAQCTGTPTGAEPIPDTDAASQIATITDRVEELRGLEAREPVTPTFLTSAEIERRVTDLTLEDYPAEEAEIDARLLVALGAIPPGYDLRAQQAELVSGQVAGFYEPDTGELVVRSDDVAQPLDGLEQMTLAHEIQHALADQGLELDAEDPERPTDQDRANLALIEGDAVLTMQQFGVSALDITDQLAGAADPELLQQQQEFADFPYALQAPLLFSYTEGLNFVCAEYAEGGWTAVDQLYRARPQTTAEILFPERYPLTPAEPRAPGAPGRGWERVRSDTFGAADLLWLFEAPGDRRGDPLDQPRERAGNWAGGTVVVSTRGDDTAVGLALQGGGGGPALCDSLELWYSAAFPDAGQVQPEDARRAWDGATQDAVLACEGDEVRLGIAPDLSTARALTE
jgi:hypothetical protein